MTELFTIRDARKEDMFLVDLYAKAEGMDRDEVVGFCRLQDDVNGIAYVNPIVTYAPWRGYGVGKALIEDAQAIAGELRLISRGTSEGGLKPIRLQPQKIAICAPTGPNAVRFPCGSQSNKGATESCELPVPANAFERPWWSSPLAQALSKLCID